jgi:hypothetical protein
VTAELSYNLEVIARMNEVILQVASDRRSRAHVWGTDKQHARAHHEGRVFLDILDAAISGVNRLSKFHDSGFENWNTHVEHVLESSRSLREEVHYHPTWWPHIAPIAERLAQR